MRIHTDKLTRADLTTALRDAGLNDVWVEDCTEHRSNSRARGFEVRLAAEPRKGRRRRNTGRYGAEDAGQQMFWAAATYDEHGYWMARLYEKDAEAIVAYYKGALDFHNSTSGKFLIEHDWQKGGRLRQNYEGQDTMCLAQCGTCGRVWNDALITGRTPVPSGRCPFEYEHDEQAA